MSILKNIIIRAKFRFGQFWYAMTYLIEQIRAFTDRGLTEDRIKKALKFFSSVLSILVAYEKICPSCWSSKYKAILVAVQVLVSVLSGAKPNGEDLQRAFASVDRAIDEW